MPYTRFDNNSMTETGYVFLDTETTGLDDDAQVVEIAIVNADGAVIFESYVKTTVSVDAEAQAVHGISPEKLASCHRLTYQAPAFFSIKSRHATCNEGLQGCPFNASRNTPV